MVFLQFTIIHTSPSYNQVIYYILLHHSTLHSTSTRIIKSSKNEVPQNCGNKAIKTLYSSTCNQNMGIFRTENYNFCRDIYAIIPNHPGVHRCYKMIRYWRLTVSMCGWWQFDTKFLDFKMFWKIWRLFSRIFKFWASHLWKIYFFQWSVGSKEKMRTTASLWPDRLLLSS